MKTLSRIFFHAKLIVNTRVWRSSNGTIKEFLSDYLIIVLNNAAKSGPRLGANKVVAGNTIPELINTIEYLNDKNIAVTVDNLGNLSVQLKKVIMLKNKF